MSSDSKSSPNKQYTAQSIKVLEGLEGVRKRPAMYIGSTSSRGLHHLVYEVVDNSVDEALAGHCDKIDIWLHQDGSCSVKDNGRGIPTDKHPVEKVSAAQVVLTKLHAGGKFEKDAYRYSGGLHGVGVSVVNALSSWLKLRIWKNGEEFEQSYTVGSPDYELKSVGATKQNGTMVQFLPDSSIFETVEFQYEILAARFRELAFLNRGLTITLNDERTETEQVFFFKEGITSFVKHISEKKNPLFKEVIELTRDDDTYVLDLAMQYNEGFSEQTYSFVNNIRTTEGGTHESGFKSALTKICNRYGQKFNMLKDGSLSSDDVREGLIAVLSIKVPEPQFEGQTKTKLGNSDVKGLVDSWVYAFLDTYFEENPTIARKILNKAILANQARSAAKKARELTRRKTALESAVLPGKLSDCSDTSPEKCELFIVEGDSAGGTAKQGRNRFVQAVLPLRGKILNVEKARLDRMLANNEVKNLITAIGAGIGNDDFNIEKVRYHKIVIMTDADVDGAHIRILLLTFFFRYMKPLIDSGYLYIANPPLYKVKIGRMEKYLHNEDEFTEMLYSWGQENLTISHSERTLPQDESIKLISALAVYEKALKKLSRKLSLPKEYIHRLIRNLKGIGSESSPQEIKKALEAGLTDYDINFNETLEGLPPSTLILTRNKTSWKAPLSFFTSPEAAKAYELFSEHTAFEEGTIALSTGKKDIDISAGVLSLAQGVIEAGKTVMSVQRYKGLGEMNADQLWETTMCPDRRLFYQVTIDDAIKADESFCALMGEVAEERRVYIESEAQFVRNLDV